MLMSTGCLATGCLAWLPGSQFSNFTFNIFIHLRQISQYSISKGSQEVFSGGFLDPGFALFRRPGIGILKQNGGETRDVQDAPLPK